MYEILGDDNYAPLIAVPKNGTACRQLNYISTKGKIYAQKNRNRRFEEQARPVSA